MLEACKVLENEGFQVEYIGVDGKCRLDMEQLRAAIDEETTLISIMAVNNETGAKMPVSEIAKLKGNAVFHTDGVQAFGKIDLKNIGADFITVSGHKIHGPKGVGALYARKGVRLPAFIAGGGQERGMRSGTENVPGIIGFGKAVEKACGNLEKRTAHMAGNQSIFFGRSAGGNFRYQTERTRRPFGSSFRCTQYQLYGDQRRSASAHT